MIEIEKEEFELYLLLHQQKYNKRPVDCSIDINKYHKRLYLNCHDIKWQMECSLRVDSGTSLI